MANSVDNFEAIGDKCIAVEVKEGFDNFNLSGTDVRIEMRPRTGVGKFTNFSKRVEVIIDNPNTKYPKGTHLWVSHMVVNGGFFNEDISDKKLYPIFDGNVAFVGGDITNVTSDNWVLIKNRPARTSSKNGVINYEDERNDIGIIVSDNFEGLNAGDEITWLPGKRSEFWQKEVQYWGILREQITSRNGEPFGSFYEMDKFDSLEFENNGITVRGKEAAQIKYKVQPKRHQYLARLSNPNLPYHNKVAIVFQHKSTVDYASNVIYLVEDELIVMD
jgi:hypothetical protein|tara:strand:+ start:1347 stop:2171 length:825 start_codon:yes stop_codon:yes gene_type:complete